MAHIYRAIHFTSGYASFLVIFVCNYQGRLQVTPTCLLMTRHWQQVSSLSWEFRASELRNYSHLCRGRNYQLRHLLLRVDKINIRT